MKTDHWFDRLHRVVLSHAPRREVVRVAGALLAGGLVGRRETGGAGAAQERCSRSLCRRHFETKKDRDFCEIKCGRCRIREKFCIIGSGRATCCHEDEKCCQNGKDCCPEDFVCCLADNVVACCPNGQECCPHSRAGAAPRTRPTVRIPTAAALTRAAATTIAAGAATPARAARPASTAPSAARAGTYRAGASAVPTAGPALTAGASRAANRAGRSAPSASPTSTPIASIAVRAETSTISICRASAVSATANPGKIAARSTASALRRRRHEGPLLPA